MVLAVFNSVVNAGICYQNKWERSWKPSPFLTSTCLVAVWRGCEVDVRWMADYRFWWQKMLDGTTDGCSHWVWKVTQILKLFFSSSSQSVWLLSVIHPQYPRERSGCKKTTLNQRVNNRIVAVVINEPQEIFKTPVCQICCVRNETPLENWTNNDLTCTDV